MPFVSSRIHPRLGFPCFFHTPRRLFIASGFSLEEAMPNSRPRHRHHKDPTALFLPPPILHERYQLDPRSIGSGGGARVYRAWDPFQGKHVVLKRAHLSHKHEKALYAEAETLSGLHHPAIPAFVEYFEEDGRAYLVETWMEGKPMKHLRSFTLAHILWIGRQLCDVLEYLHRQHLVHRDIAPGNILVNMKNQTLSLLDFGLARLEPCATHGGEVTDGMDRAAGTPGYVAPEQWSKGAVSRACDIYGLGMVLGCALTNCQPHEVIAVRSFADLWDNPRTIPAEQVPLLGLLDRMLSSYEERRPDLSEIHFLFSHLSRQLFGTD